MVETVTDGTHKQELKFQELVTVVLSDEERRTGHLTNENMALAVLGFIRDGIAVLENAVDPEHCDKINKIMVDELPELIKDPHVHWNDVCLSSKAFRRSLFEPSTTGHPCTT